MALAHEAHPLDQLSELDSLGQRAQVHRLHGSGQLPPSPGSLAHIEITEWDDSTKEDEYVEGHGNIETIIVSAFNYQTGNRSTNVLRKVEPESQQWDTSADILTPLFTRVNGFNTYVALEMAQGHIPARVIGANQHPGTSLLEDAEVALTILNTDDVMHRPRSTEEQASPFESVLFGYSMGIMKDLALLGIAQEAGREVKFTFGLDACLALKRSYPRLLAQLGTSPGYLGQEVAELPRAFIQNLPHSPLRNNIARTRHFVRTVSPAPRFIGNGFKQFGVLAAEETGKYAADISQDAAMVLHFFQGCRYNDVDVFEERFKNHGNVKIIREGGHHLSGANPLVIGRVVSRAQLALELISQGASPADLTDAVAEPILD